MGCGVDEVFDSQGEFALIRYEMGAGELRRVGGGRAGEHNQSLGEQEGVCAVALHGILVGSPLGGVLPELHPRLARCQPEI